MIRSWTFLIQVAAVGFAQTVRTVAGPDAVNNPYGLTRAADGSLYVCEIGNHRISRIDPKTGQRTTIAGTGQKGYSGDSGPAIKAELNEPYELAFDSSE